MGGPELAIERILRFDSLVAPGPINIKKAIKVAVNFFFLSIKLPELDNRDRFPPLPLSRCQSAWGGKFNKNEVAVR